MAPVDTTGEETPPSVTEVCENFGLNDVDLEYTDADYQNLTTYKLFQQTYRQRIQAANPKVNYFDESISKWNIIFNRHVFVKVPQPRLMMLVAAKWREFQSSNPASGYNSPAAEETEQEQEEDSRPRRAG